MFKLVELVQTATMPGWAIAIKVIGISMSDVMEGPLRMPQACFLILKPGSKSRIMPSIIRRKTFCGLRIINGRASMKMARLLLQQEKLAAAERAIERALDFEKSVSMPGT